MKKITDKSKQRANLQYERAYEKRNKAERNAKNKITSNIQNKARRIMEESLWRKLKKDESVDHIKPVSKGWTNAKSNLRVMKRSKNYARWAKLKSTQR